MTEAVDERVPLFEDKNIPERIQKWADNSEAFLHVCFIYDIVSIFIMMSSRSCAAPLKIWLMGSIILGFPCTWFVTKLITRGDSHARVRRSFCVETFLNLLALIWWGLGLRWIFDEPYCAQVCPTMYYFIFLSEIIMDALTKVSAGLTSGLQFVQQKIDTVVEEHVAKGKRHTPPDADAPEGPALIRYRFVKDDEDDNVFVVPGHTAGTVTELTAGEVKSHFPLKGNYHFRYKMSPIDEGFEYIWVDVHDHDRVPTYHGNVYMKILPIPSNVAPLNIATSPRPSRNGGSQPVPHRQPSNVAVRQVSGSPAQQRPSQSPAPAPVAPTPPPAPVVMPNREELVKKREDETNARVQAKLEKHQNKVAQEEQMKAAKVEAHENLKDVLDKWAKTPEGQWKDVRTLLSTMQDVMWADSGWKPCPLSELMMSAPAVKKAYRRAIVITHPDRHQSASAEQHVRADRIFNALNESFKQS